MMEMYIILGGSILVLLIGLYTIIAGKKTTKGKQSSIDINHVNENSFQRFAKFFGEIYPHEEEFDAKLNKIYTLISEDKVTDIKKISELSFCSIPECVTKIRYLKNKRVIPDFYIDTNNLKLLECTEEDQILLGKYKPYIYGTHTQIEEFAPLLPNPKGLSVEELKKEALEDLLYLDKKGLLNGLIIDDIDGKIVYYSIEKRKTVYDRETVHCPNCGSLNDVELAGKVRCGYCKAIIIGSKYEQANGER